MYQFIRYLSVLLFYACLAEEALGQNAINGTFAHLELRPNDEIISMVLIPAGSFTMGGEKINDEKPSHTVYIRSFLMGKTEVTQKQWQEVMGNNPSHFTACGPECPVENISFYDVTKFIAKLNQNSGQKYRLPSEAEWEYAARAGSTTEWSHGMIESNLSNYAWFDRNSGGKTQVVRQKLSNAFGLFDMHGNVWEWTQDCWHGDYGGAPTDGSAWTTGCSGNYRVLRGGSWNYFPSGLRSANRYFFDPGGSYYDIGFRLALDQSEFVADATNTTKRIPPSTSSEANAAALSLKERIVYFDFDSSVIGYEARPIIEAHARRLKGNANLRVALEGHTDERGVREYSLGLGQKRADAVREAFSLLGVPESQMEAVSFGKEKPAARGYSEASMQENRRVEINYR